MSEKCVCVCEFGGWSPRSSIVYEIDGGMYGGFVVEEEGGRRNLSYLRVFVLAWLGLAWWDEDVRRVVHTRHSSMHS